MEKLNPNYRLASLPDVVLPLGGMSLVELLDVQDHFLSRAEKIGQDILAIEQYVTRAIIQQTKTPPLIEGA